MNTDQIIQHYNDLSGYISNWHMTMNRIHRVNNNLPQEIISFVDNCYDLSLMLSYLDDNLIRLENETSTPEGLDHMAYAQTRCFLEVCYFLVRVLFDNISGIIKYFYDKNEPNSGIPKNFNDLLKRAQSGKIPEDLTSVITKIKFNFIKVKDRRDDIGHNYESILVFIDKDKNGKITLEHFGTLGRSPKKYEDIRQFFGSVLCEYQELIDNLLDLFDDKFMSWYKFRPYRNLCILSGLSGNMLWWACKYGKYTNKGLIVKEIDIPN
jgi:hypothetical protein